MRMNIEELNADSFRPLMHTPFQVRVEGLSSFSMELVELTEKEPVSVSFNAKPHRQERFSLLFRGPQQPILPSNTYDIEHPQLGTHPLFICPVGQDEEGIFYESIFNRLKRVEV